MTCEMFSECEQEMIIHNFLNKIVRIETYEYLKDKCNKCEECKFNKSNMELFKLNLPNDIIKNICKMNYNECYRCHHSNEYIKEVESGKFWKPVSQYLFFNYYEFLDEEVFEEQFPQYNYQLMETLVDMMGDKEFKTKKDVREIIEYATMECDITEYVTSKVLRQFNDVIKCIFENELTAIHPLPSCPKLEI